MAESQDIFLTGFSGSGKSTIGPKLAQLLKAGFEDTDSLIVSRTGRGISELFRVKGEPYFRRTESSVIDALIHKRSGQRVIALGGGALENSDTRQKVLEEGLLIYLSCSAKEICQRLRDTADRPLMQVKLGEGQSLEQARVKRIAELLKSRETNYRKAQITFVTTGKTGDQAAHELCEIIQNYNAND